MRRVLHVIPDLTLGGAERFVLELARWQKHSGTAIPRLCVFGSPGTSMAAEGERLGAVFLRARKVNAPFRTSTLRRLMKVSREFQPDVLHSHLWPAALAGAVVSQMLRLKHVVHIQDTRPFLRSQDMKSRLRRHLYRNLLSRSNARYIAVSRCARDFTASPMRINEREIEVIPNGINPEVFDSPPNTEQRATRRTGVVIGAAGRLVPDKGFEDLIVAVGALCREFPRLVLKIAGSGSHLSVLQQLATRTGMSPHIQWLGRVDDMKTFYSGCDLFVLPSRGHEGMPIVVLEAMASGVPVVATRCAGVDEAIQDGREGILVPLRNTTELSLAISRLAGDGLLRRRMGDAASKAARSFLIPDIGSRINDVYAHLHQPYH